MGRDEVFFVGRDEVFFVGRSGSVAVPAAECLETLDGIRDRVVLDGKIEVEATSQKNPRPGSSTESRVGGRRHSSYVARDFHLVKKILGLPRSTSILFGGGRVRGPRAILRPGEALQDREHFQVGRLDRPERHVGRQSHDPALFRLFPSILGTFALTYTVRTGRLSRSKKS